MTTERYYTAAEVADIVIDGLLEDKLAGAADAARLNPRVHLDLPGQPASMMLAIGDTRTIALLHDYVQMETVLGVAEVFYEDLPRPDECDRIAFCVRFPVEVAGMVSGFRVYDHRGNVAATHSLEDSKDVRVGDLFELLLTVDAATLQVIAVCKMRDGARWG